jgi:hypothetical protein
MQVGVIVFLTVLVFVLVHKQLVLAAGQPISRPNDSLPREFGRMAAGKGQKAYMTTSDDVGFLW